MKKLPPETKNLARNNKILTSTTDKSGFFQIDKMTPVETEIKVMLVCLFNT
jgi:hypothetical protein